MRIGLSFSRCVCDIVDGKVNIDDILVIIARTDFNPHNDEHWDSIWRGYRTRGLGSAPEWFSYPASDEDTFRQISIDLYDLGKLHQPRQFGGYPRRSQHVWLEAALLSEDIEGNPAVKAAWEQFQIVAGLAGINTATDDYF